MKKLARDLQPGDILQAPRRVVLYQMNSPLSESRIAIATHTIGDKQPPIPEWIDGTAEVEVESGVLTPAQQHADELLKRLKWAVGFIETYARDCIGPATPEMNKARDVIALADTPPTAPTLAEALAALETLADGAQRVQSGDWEAADTEARVKARALLERARAAGVL